VNIAFQNIRFANNELARKHYRDYSKSLWTRGNLFSLRESNVTAGTEDLRDRFNRWFRWTVSCVISCSNSFAAAR
jgi:hypothetical protein